MLGESMSKSVAAAANAPRAKSLARNKILKKKDQVQPAEEGQVVHHDQAPAHLAQTHDASMIAVAETSLEGDFSFAQVLADAQASEASFYMDAGASMGGTVSFLQDDTTSGGSDEGGGASTALLVGGGLLAAGAVIAVASDGDDDDDTPTAPANKAPTVTAPATVNVTEDTTTTGKLTATDPDGDALTFTVKGTAPQGFTLNKDGSYTIDTKGSEYQSLNTGQSKDYSVTFNVSDGKGGSTDGTLTYKVAGVNEGPATATIAVTGAGSNTDADTVNTTYNVSTGNYTYTINGFDPGDRIVSPAGSNPGTIDNPSFTDGKAVIQYANAGLVTRIELVGLTEAQDKGILFTSDLNTVYGAGTFA